MAEKNILSRIQLKYDTYANWTSETLGDGKGAKLVLKAGEIGICAIPSGSNAVNGDTARPQIMFKVGDGTSAFSALPWASAKAADVYAWAKQDEATFTTWVKGLIDVSDIDLSGYYKKTEVDGLLTNNSTADQKYAKDYADALITALDVTDIAVAGQYVSAVSETDGKISVTRADLPTYALATGTANGTVKFNGTDVAVKGLGSAAYTETGAYATAAQGAKADSAVQSITVLGHTLEDGDSVTVEQAKTDLGLKSAAYTESSAYATAAQGALADSALQKADITTGGANGTIAVEGTDVAVKGLGSAAYTEASAYDEAGAAKAVQDDLDDYKTSNDAAVKAAKDLADENKATLEAFFNENAVSDGVVNTLKEIQEQLDAGEGSASSLLAEINKIKDGSTIVSKATHAVNADEATHAAEADEADHAAAADDATKLGGVAAANYALKSDLTGGNITVAKATEASGLDSTGVAQVKEIKVNEATAADTAAHADAATTVDANGVTTASIADKAVTAAKLADDVTTLIQNTKVKNATAADDAAKLGGIAAADYATKTYADQAEADAITAANEYADGLAKNYATAAQGTKADSALQEVKVGTGLTVTAKDANSQTINIDETTVFVINCGTASTVL